MTLKEYATSIGISYETAKKRRQRGQIVLTGDAWGQASGDIGTETASSGTKGTENTGTSEPFVALESLPHVKGQPMPYPAELLECATCAENERDIEHLRAQVTHWQTRFDAKESECDRLTQELSEMRECAMYWQREALQYRPASETALDADTFAEPRGSHEPDDEPHTDAEWLPNKIYSSGAFLKECQSIVKKLTGYSISPDLLRERLRQARIQPDTETRFYYPRHLEQFQSYVTRRLEAE